MHMCLEFLNVGKHYLEFLNVGNVVKRSFSFFFKIGNIVKSFKMKQKIKMSYPDL